MYKRDLITAEIQKLTEVLARILGLKKEGKEEEADLLFTATLEEKFGITTADLNDAVSFDTIIKRAQMAPETLDMLTKFLFSKLQSAASPGYNTMIANRLQYLFQYLEFEHHIVSLENMDRQRTIQKYL